MSASHYVPNHWCEDHKHPLREVAFFLYDNADNMDPEHVSQLVKKLQPIDDEYRKGKG